MSSSLLVVSGLPRSGTSLMMAALAAGGLDLISDHNRPADQHNPGGYFEDRRVSNLAQQADWLVGHDGKGIKILSHLLCEIPPFVQARVLFMRRPLPQILASQNAMLGRRETPPELASLIARDLAQTLQWLGEQTHLSALEVSYTEVLRDPRAEFGRVLDFLTGDWNLEAMISTVDPRLYRQKQG